MRERTEWLPYGKQTLDDADIQAVVEVLRSDYLTTGAKIPEFEAAFAEYVGAQYAVAVANGTAALHAAAFVAGIGVGDEVITTPITFAATANCLLYLGARPVFADILEDTYQIDPEQVRTKITRKTKALLPVHFTGQPVDLKRIHDLAAEYNLLVIEDAAHALGATYHGHRIGSCSDLTTFSFHPVKQITTGEGGMITTNDSVFYQQLLEFRTHGITRNPELLSRDEGAWYYEQQSLGYNYRLTDLQAALGLSQLKKSDQFLKRRREIANTYQQALAGLKGLILPTLAAAIVSSWHLYIIRLNPKVVKVSRRQIFEELRARKIGVNVHYLPVYAHPYYQSLGYPKGLCPYAEAFYETALTLPLFPAMTEQDVTDVIEAVSEVIVAAT